MNDEIAALLRQACVGHPAAEIPWPHRLLHDAADTIETLQAKLAEAEAKVVALKERFRVIEGHIGFYGNPGDLESVIRSIVEQRDRLTEELRVAKHVLEMRIAPVGDTSVYQDQQINRSLKLLSCEGSHSVLEDENTELLKRVEEAERDKVRLDWMEEFIQTGVIETAFEMDGGIHLTLSTVGDHEEKAYREQNCLREAIDAALAGGNTEGEKG